MLEVWPIELPVVEVAQNYKFSAACDSTESWLFGFTFFLH